MRIRVLGGLAVEGVADRELGSRKARTLVKALALARGAPVSVDRLAGLLWPDRAPAKPAEQVAVLVSRLRNVVGAERLERREAGYALHVDWLDLDELGRRVGEATTALDENRTGAARAAASAALALARGPLLPDDEGEWVEADRAVADALIAAARRVAAESAGRAGDHLAAVAAAESALVHDPYDERTLRTLMAAHAAAGSPASALAAYVRVRDRLVEDLGVSPTAETEELHDRILLAPADGDRRRDMSEAGQLPGRAGATAALDAALHRSRATSSPAVVAVVGSAGIGKSALLDHWSGTVGARAMVVLGRCDPLGRDLPLQPIVDALALRIGALGEEARTAVLGKQAAILLPLLGTEPAPGTALVTDAEFGRAEMFAALLAVLHRLAEGRPVVVIVDDLHHAGATTRSWLAHAARRAGEVLIVTASRPGESAVLEGADVVELGPLDLETTSALVGADRAPALHARSGGNPLLLHALARLPDAATPNAATPDTLRDAVNRRLADLDGASTVRTAAALGPEVDLDLLAEVTGRSTLEVLGQLEAAEVAGVLVERAHGYAFRHELEREVLEQGLSAARRALLHRAAARSLAGRPSVDPLGVVRHAQLGGDLALAVTWSTRAAEVALARWDVEAAAAHVDTALHLDPGAPAALLARTRLHLASGALEEAADDAARAVAAGGGAEVLELSGWVAYYRRRYQEAVAFAEAGLRRTSDPGIRASCLALAGRVRHGTGDLPAAVERLQAAADEQGPADLHALAGVWLAHVRVHQGRSSEALTLLDRSLVDPERLGHPFAALHGVFARVMALGQVGRPKEALDACDHLDAEIGRRGPVGRRLEAPALNVRAWVLRHTGDPSRADELNRRAIDAGGSSGRLTEAYYAGMLDLADGRLLAGDDGGAAEILDRVAPLETWEGTMAWHQRHRWLLLRARLALRDGDRTTAQVLAAAVAADAGSRGAGRYEVLATGLLAVAGGETSRVPWVLGRLPTCAALDGTWLADSLAEGGGYGR